MLLFAFDAVLRLKFATSSLPRLARLEELRRLPGPASRPHKAYQNFLKFGNFEVNLGKEPGADIALVPTKPKKRY